MDTKQADIQAIDMETPEQPESAHHEDDFNAQWIQAQQEISELQTENARLRKHVLESYVRFAAFEKGVAKEKMGYVVRLVNLDGIEADISEVAFSAVEDAVGQVIKDLPELCIKATGIGTGSDGNHARSSAGKRNEQAVEQAFLQGLHR